MRLLRKIRKEKGFSFRSLSNECGVPVSTISDYEKCKIKDLNKKSLGKIAEALGSTIEEIQKYSDSKKIMKCLNQACPLNVDKECNNDVVLENRAPCFGKDLVKPKPIKINYNNINSVFAK